MVMAGYWLAANNSFVSTIEDRFDITSDITVIKPDYQQYVDALASSSRVFIDLSLHTEAEKVDQRPSTSWLSLVLLSTLTGRLRRLD